jgi:hypothetical protein
MRKVLRSKTDFNNFQIGCENRINEDLLIAFGKRFGPTLRILDLNTVTSHSMTVKILSHCCVLDTLAINIINLQTLGSSEIEDLKKIDKVLSNLRNVSIGNVTVYEESEMAYLGKFLSLCSNLNSLLFYIMFMNHT